ncbi:MAG: exodeoxyribonuclease VII small subunit [Bacteroidales bacterium]|nr:exodeoxyribonuclease VII small subunit [Bacteroidales bacterium]
MSASELTYTSAMKELEAIVEQLQDPQCEVDRLCDLTRRSVELLKFCRKKLTSTDEELTKLLENID